jgi:hypothetical protein
MVRLMAGRVCTRRSGLPSALVLERRAAKDAKDAKGRILRRILTFAALWLGGSPSLSGAHAELGPKRN